MFVSLFFNSEKLAPIILNVVTYLCNSPASSRCPSLIATLAPCMDALLTLLGISLPISGCPHVDALLTLLGIYPLCPIPPTRPLTPYTGVPPLPASTYIDAPLPCLGFGTPSQIVLFIPFGL